MAIDWINEHKITAKEAARLLPSRKTGRPSHVSRAIRMMTDGVLGPDKQRHYLECAYANEWITTVEAIERFLQALSPQPQAAARPATTAPLRNAAHDLATKQCEALGL